MTSLLPAEARTPTGRRVQIAALLHHLRTRVGFTQGAVGARLWPGKPTGAVQNKVARLESGEAPIDMADLREMLALYRVEDEATRDLALRLQTGTSQRGRWVGYRAVYPKTHRRLIDLEEDAVLLRLVSTEQIPELLQSGAFMRAEISGSPTGAFERVLRARQARQEVLFRDDPPQCYAVLSESCVRRVRGGDSVMHQQIKHLISLSEQPHISIQISPFDIRVHRPGASLPGTAEEAGMLQRFALYRLAAPGVLDDMAGYLDFAFSLVAHDLIWRDDITPYEEIWGRATDAALTPTESRSFLQDLLREYR